MESTADSHVLTTKQKKIIKDTWKMITREIRLSLSNLFTDFLTAYPAYGSIFGIKKGELLKDNKRLVTHGNNVKTILTYIIEHAVDDQFLFESHIITLGRHHVSMPIEPIHFKNFASILLNNLRIALGKQMLPEIEQAWVIFLERITEIIRVTLLSERGLPVHEETYKIKLKP